MASSGSKYINVADTTSGSYTDGVRLLVEWAERSQSVANNSTVIRITLKIVTGRYGAMYGSATQTWKISCAGKSKSDTFTIQQGNNATRTLGYMDATINHAADGKGSFTANVQASFNMDFNGWVGTIKGSISGTLDTIPRASKPSVSGSLEMGGAITIKTNRASSGFTHTLKYNFQGHQAVIAEDVEASYAWTPPLDTFAPWLTNATQADCTIICNTYNGSTLIGTAETDFKLKVPASVVPTISNIVLSDPQGFFGTYGVYMQGSDLKAVITAAGAKGSTISKYAMRLDSGAAVEGTTGTLIKESAFVLAGASASDEYQSQHTVTVTVTDSRGRQTTETRKVTFESSGLCTVIATAMRWDAVADREDDESTTVRVKATIECHDVNGKGINVPEAHVEIKEIGAADYTEKYSQTGTSSILEIEYDITGVETSKAYDVRIRYKDALTDYFSQYVINVPTATPVIDLLAGGNGIGFLTVADAEGYIKLGGKVRVDASDGSMQYLDNSGKQNYFIMFRPGDGVPEFFSGAIIPLNSSLEFGSAAIKAESGGTLGFYWGLDAPSSKGMMRKTIWEGSWSSGEITIAAQMSYNFFVIHTSGQSQVMLGIRENPGGAGSRITLFSIYSNNGYHYTFAGNITSTSEFTWNLAANSMFYVRHNPGASHAASTAQTITKIEGII